MADTSSIGRYGEQTVIELFDGGHDYPSLIKFSTVNEAGTTLTRYLGLDGAGRFVSWPETPDNYTEGQDTTDGDEREVVGDQTGVE